MRGNLTSAAASLSWQTREVLETLLCGALIVPKIVEADARKVRALLVTMWLDGLATWSEESSDFWVFRITDDGRAAFAGRRDVNDEFGRHDEGARRLQ
jgi:hypothetical protein